MMKINAKDIIRIVFIILSISSLYFVPWKLVKGWIKPIPKTVQIQIESAIDQGFEGVVVFVDMKGEPIQSLASGWHNKELEKPAKADALFKIASINKLYDAVALAKLVNSSVLSLDKTIADYLPQIADQIENAELITLKMMANHRSGIPNFTDSPNFWASPPETYEENLALILGKEANFKPDQKYEYCNTNYLLLNKIMDNALGYPNFEFIKAEIIEPLHLSNTFSSLSEVNMEDVMSGYHIGYPFDLKSEDYGMLASAQDVGVFLRALNDGTVFNGDERAIYESIYEFEHDGWVPGYQSFAKYYKDIDAIVISFYSTTDAKLMMWNLAEIINKRIYKILKRSQ